MSARSATKTANCFASRVLFHLLSQSIRLRCRSLLSLLHMELEQILCLAAHERNIENIYDEEGKSIYQAGNFSETTGLFGLILRYNMTMPIMTPKKASFCNMFVPSPPISEVFLTGRCSGSFSSVTSKLSSSRTGRAEPMVSYPSISKL